MIGGLHKDSKGYWRYRPSSAGLPKGTPRPVPISLGTKNEAEALRRLVETRGLEVVGRAAGDTVTRTLSEWISLYLEERARVGRHGEHTTRQMAGSLAKVVEFFGDVQPGKLDRPGVMNFYASLQEGRSHGTVHRYMRYLRALLCWLVERQVITGNPASALRLPVVRQTRREMFCTREQRDHLLACCEGQGQQDVRFVLMAGFYLGLRINEIVNCRWGWFQGAGGQGHCVVSGEVDGFATKSRKSRTVPLHPVFQSYLQGLKQGGLSDFVVRPEKVQGKQWLRWDPRVPFNAVCAAAGLEWVTPHVMRHTFGSLHAMAGTPEIKIRRWMGITQATLDRHYSGLSPDDADVGVI